MKYRNNRGFLIFALAIFYHLNLNAQKIIIGTEKSALVYSVNKDKQLNQIYFGTNLLDSASYRNINAYELPAYATGGATYLQEPALAVTHADGNMSLQLAYLSKEIRKLDDNVIETNIRLKDPAYDFYVNLHFKAFQKENIIETWTVIENQEKGDVLLNRYASVFLNFPGATNYLTRFNGDWGIEAQMEQFLLPNGLYSIQSKLGVKTVENGLSSFMLSKEQLDDENKGEVFGGSLAWSGNFDLQFETFKNNSRLGEALKVICGINAYASAYRLKTKESFSTPHFIFTYTNGGQGQVSRNFHHWAIKNGIWKGEQRRQTLLNNWEATYFKFNQDTLVNLFDGAKKLGVDLFLLDDGWFANKYPRDNDKAGLGDWEVNKKKLTNGISYLVKEAKNKNINFGIWIEPEMVNPKSELYEKHPDWLLKAPNRPEDLQRTQLVLDLSNPKVQDFVFGVVDNLMRQSPGIAYMKWDCNRVMSNPYSVFMGKDQNALFVKYTQGLYHVLNRVRAKYPDLEMMLCASGGARVEYGALKYFQEFWASDNTNPLDRIKIQWGYSYFFPALTICNHVTDWGKQSLKFKLDVAMSGKMGFDVQVKKMSQKDIEFSKAAVENYKRLQPLINYGDLYRLVSPYKTNSASLMYIDSTKTNAILFAYNLMVSEAQNYPAIILNGLDPKKKYKIKEINLRAEAKPQFTEDGQVYSGESLMSSGLKWYLFRSETSSILTLEAI
ncbi:alpha-galactosidase [Pedobacter jeongneungensis]|uniref:alpha-galactosidase n=1 Tax=Pedobacter jeongneungensis TaxID=947309 RepID=UPI0031D7F778